MVLESGDKLMICEVCKGDAVVLRRKINAAGVSMFMWYCPDHDGNHAKKDSKWIKKSTVQQWIDSGRLKLDCVEDVPIAADYSKDAPKCCVCGRPAELHHWFPQTFMELAGEDWFKYPVSPLCKFHHDKWHNIVTWYLPGRTDKALANEVKSRYFERQMEATA